MNILVIGGTRFFGVHMVNALLGRGHRVTLATRGLASDSFGGKVNRIILDRSSSGSVKQALSGKKFDVVIDKIAYSSNDVRRVLENVSCDKYVLMSSSAVYEPLHFGTKEDEFNGKDGELVWCERKDLPYAQAKQNAERALCQNFPSQKYAAVRYPFVTGMDDYTGRLAFYVEHVMDGKPMFVDNPDNEMSFMNSKEAGEFLAHVAESDFEGDINGASVGTVSLSQIISCIEEATGRKAVLSADGDAAPYNGTPGNSLDIQRAEKTGFKFSRLDDWIFDLVRGLASEK